MASAIKNRNENLQIKQTWNFICKQHDHSVGSVENSTGSTNKQVEVIQEFNKAVVYITQKWVLLDTSNRQLQSEIERQHCHLQ